MGEKTYAFSFFKDWDSNLMNAVKQPCCFYGYDEYGFVLVKADSSDYQSIIDPDSLYVRVLNGTLTQTKWGWWIRNQVRRRLKVLKPNIKKASCFFVHGPG